MHNKKTYLIVDGYNIINAWEELLEAMKFSLERARDMLIDQLNEYQKMTEENISLVFDAHMVEGAIFSKERVKNIDVIFTKEHETADQYIERLVDQFGRRKTIRVASSDAMIQRMVLARGATRISAKELKAELIEVKQSAKRLEKGLKKKSSRGLVEIDGDNLELLENLLEEARK